MHYCVSLITEKIPTEKDIDRIMSPYYEGNIDYEKDERPVFSWDYWTIGGRYCGRIKLKMDKDDEEYKWKYLPREPREGRLFLSSILRELHDNASRQHFTFYEETQYYGYMGDYTYLQVDGARVRDILNLENLDCFIFIDKTGNAFARETWNGGTFDKDEHFDENYKATLETSKDCFLTVLDIHN